MSCPFSAQELRDLITKLERLETWQKQAEASAGSSSRGYTRGDPKARAKAAGPVLSKPVFPAIPQIAFRFTLVKEAGPEFIGAPFPGVEEGPGPLPALLQDQAIFLDCDEREALQRVHLSFAAGFWARASLETHCHTFTPPVVSTPSKHTIVLRACGLGGFVRFAAVDHVQKFSDLCFSEVSLYHSFATETELEIYCQGARIAVPALWEPC